MIHFPISILTEFIIGIFVWWVAVYLVSQNPFNKLVWLVFGISVCISLYFTGDIFFYAVESTRYFTALAVVMKWVVWTIYLPTALLYHASLLIRKKVSALQRMSIYIAYLLVSSAIFIETFTNLSRKYDLISSSAFNGDMTTATAKYFWVILVLITSVSLGTLYNLYLSLKEQSKYSKDWYKFFWPFLGTLSVTIAGPIAVLGYYNIIPHMPLVPTLAFALLVISLVYSMARYNLFLDETKTVFGKNFLYSSITIFFIILLLLTILLISKTSYNSIPSLIFPFLLIYFIIASHPAYNWIYTFVEDAIYNSSSGLSVVNDEEVSFAIVNFNNPERLADSTLFRLNLFGPSGKENLKIDVLKQAVREAIEYFKPEDENLHRRTKQSLKYCLLKMLAFDQAEEGQILWELGFDEYPVKLMRMEKRERPPKFRDFSPADYHYTSRNAYLALKKEAIHDVTWRISYLEKLSKK